jgi:hypothetical protein
MTLKPRRTNTPQTAPERAGLVVGSEEREVSNQKTDFCWVAHAILSSKFAESLFDTILKEIFRDRRQQFAERRI